MKSSSRILSGVSLAAIYCFALCVITKSFDYSVFQDYSTSPKEEIIGDFSKKLFCHTSQSENTVSNNNNVPVPNFKSPLNGFWAIVYTTEQLTETEFYQYTNISKNFLIQHRKSDIIFPFHYFW